MVQIMQFLHMQGDPFHFLSKMVNTKCTKTKCTKTLYDTCDWNNQM